jgi:hypothetical protein
MNTATGLTDLPASELHMDILHPYTVRYLDRNSDGYEFCCYAYNKMHAKLQAMEMVQAIHDNPDCIVWVLKESTDFDW